MKQFLFGQWLSGASTQTSKESTLIFLEVGLKEINKFKTTYLAAGGNEDFIEYKHLVRAIENCKAYAGDTDEGRLDFDINYDYLSSQLYKISETLKKEMPNFTF